MSTYGAAITRTALQGVQQRDIRVLDVEQGHVTFAVVTDPITEALEVDFYYQYNNWLDNAVNDDFYRKGSGYRVLRRSIF